MNKNEVDFETVVLDYLSQRGYVRRELLIKYLRESHSNKTGYSLASINRKLENMHKAGLILILKKQTDLDRYSIKKENGKASYLFAKSSTERTRHLSTVLDLLKTGDNIDKEMVLGEIKRYEKKYVLDPNQLDTLVLSLDDNDVDLIDSLIEILHNHITIKGIEPGNKTIFLDKLRKLLDKYPEGHSQYKMLKRHIIRLLGYYNDKTVLEQLSKDTESGKLSTFQGCYGDKFTARVIEEGMTELFYLEKKLRKEGDTETANVLSQIRDQAEKNVEKPIDSD